MSLRSRAKKLLYRYVPGFVGTYPYFDVKVHYPRGAWIIDEACIQGIFEPKTTYLVSRMIRPETWYYDIGANLGFLSIPILKLHPNVRVVSFEPSPTYLPYLTQTAKESPYADRWQVVGVAIGASIGEVEFGVGSASAFDDMIANPTYQKRAQRTVRVPLTTVDEFWHSAGQPNVSVIKIDTEGAEFQGLKGAVECLKTCRPVVVMECSEPHLRAFGHTPAEIFEWIHDNDYTVSQLPQIIPVRSAGEFQAHLIESYNFLLLPARQK
jgi:FkbM family methyltransferase